MYTISKGELWTIRNALEDRCEDAEYADDALSIVHGILDKGVQVDITGQITNPVELNEEELRAIEEEEYRTC